MLTRSMLCLLVVGQMIACGDDDAESRPEHDAGRDASSDAGPAIHQIDRSALVDVGTEGRLDYATPEYWVCRPDIEPSECARDLDATEIKADGTLEVVKHVPASDPSFDCFYVYPTVWLNKTAQMTDFSDEGVKFVRDALLSQGARFNRVCRMFAPLYRQSGLAGNMLVAGSNKQLALQDVRDAFAHYLEHDNGGRRFVLLGHSQGSFMLSSLIQRDIDTVPELRERMISALLLGGQPYTQPGELVGGSFQNVPICTQKGQTGCVIAYNSFAVEAPPGASSLFGKVGTELANEEVDLDGRVMCVEPAAIAGNAGRYAGSYFAMRLENPTFGTPPAIPGVNTPFLLIRDILRGECVLREGRSYLEVSYVPEPGDVRPMPNYRNQLLESLGFGLHLVDYNIALDDLIEAVRLQAAASE